MDTEQQVKEIAEAAAPALNEALTQLMTWAQAGVGFAQEQMPLLAKEIVMFGIGINALWVVVGIMAWIVSGVLCRYAIPWAKEYSNVSEGGSWAILFFC